MSLRTKKRARYCRLNRPREWWPLDDVLRYLKGHLDDRHKMAGMLARGIHVRFAPNATMLVAVNHREHAALLRGESIRKLEVLVEAARSSTEWVDVADLPEVFMSRRNSRGWIEWFDDDAELGWVAWTLPF